jgi:hypothetical protein
MTEAADKQVQELWDTLDKDGNGTLDSSEVAVLLKLMGKDIDIDDMMEELCVTFYLACGYAAPLTILRNCSDTDGDGSVDRVEFSEWFRAQEEMEMDDLLDSINIEGFLSGSDGEGDLSGDSDSADDPPEPPPAPVPAANPEMHTRNTARGDSPTGIRDLGKQSLVSQRLALLNHTGSDDTDIASCLLRPAAHRSEADLRLLVTLFGASCSFFKALLSETLRLEVCRHLCHKKMDADITVFEQGDIGDNFYVIVSGSVRVLIDGEVVSHLGSAGESFGELSLTGVTESERLRAATIITDEETVFATLDRLEYTQLVDSHGWSREGLDGVVGSRKAGIKEEPSFKVRRVKNKMNQKCTLKVGQMGLQVLSGDGTKPLETHLYKAIATWEALEDSFVVELAQDGRQLSFKTDEAGAIDEAMRANAVQLASMQKQQHDRAAQQAARKQQLLEGPTTYNVDYDGRSVELTVSVKNGVQVFAQGNMTNWFPFIEIKSWAESASTSVRMLDGGSEEHEFELSNTGELIEALEVCSAQAAADIKVVKPQDNASRMEAELAVAAEIPTYSVKRGSKHCTLSITGMSVQLTDHQKKSMGNILFAQINLEDTKATYNNGTKTYDGLLIVEAGGRRHTFKTDKGNEIVKCIAERAQPLVQMEALVKASNEEEARNLSAPPNAAKKPPKVPKAPKAAKKLQPELQQLQQAEPLSAAERRKRRSTERAQNDMHTWKCSTAENGSWLQNLYPHDSSWLHVDRVATFPPAASWVDMHLDRMYPLLKTMVDEICMAAPPPTSLFPRVADLFSGASMGRAARGLLSVYPAKCTLIDCDAASLALAEERALGVCKNVDTFETDAAQTYAETLKLGRLVPSTYEFVISCLGISRAATQASVSAVDEWLHFVRSMLASVMETLEPGGHVIIGEQANCLSAYAYLRLLEEAGFVDVDLSWRSQNFFVCGGRRSATTGPGAGMVRNSRPRRTQKPKRTQPAKPKAVPGPKKEKAKLKPGQIAVTFKEAGSLGLKFTPKDDHIEVLGLNPGTQAERHSKLRAGLQLLRVGETPVEGMGYPQVITLLKAAGRPVRLLFRVKQKQDDKKKSPEGEALRAWLTERGLGLYSEAVLLSFLKAGYAKHLYHRYDYCHSNNQRFTFWYAPVVRYPPKEWIATLDGLADEGILEPFLKSVREHYAKGENWTHVSASRQKQHEFFLMGIDLLEPLSEAERAEVSHTYLNIWLARIFINPLFP